MKLNLNNHNIYKTTKIKKIMLKIIKKNKQLLKDNLILFIGLFLNGAFAYIYHFIMGRALGPVDYGILNIIIAINYIIVVFFNAIQTSITQYTAKYKSQNQPGKINTLIRKTSKQLLKTSIIISLIFSLTIPLIGSFLHLENPWILLWCIPLIIFSLIYPITRGALQGLQSFAKLSLSYIGEGSIKVITGVILIFLGLRLHGALAALGFALILSYPITFKPLKKIFNTKPKKIQIKEIYSYSLPVVLAFLLITLMFSLDILLVKHFLSPEQAGFYAALAILSKVIFFSITPLAQVMFPKITEAKQSKNNYNHLLYKTLFISLIIIAIILVIYFGVPSLAVTILFGSAYQAIIPLLGLMGVMMSFLSLAYVLVFYNLSIERYNFIWIILTFLVVEIVILFLFHNNLETIVKNLTIIMGLFFLSMGIYSLTKQTKSPQS